MNSRDTILSRLRNAHAEVHLPDAEAEPAPPPARRPPGECLARFQAELAALGVDCFVEPSADAVTSRLRQLIDGRPTLAWDAAHLPYDAANTLTGATLGRATRDTQAAAEVGVTGCDAAIAETGSLVLLSAPGRSRAVSLLPPFHIALVRRTQVCFSMAEFFADRTDNLRQSASCTFITGPSRTADIELTLTLGIHGPGRVAVIVGP